MLADTMMPEAVEHAGRLVGLLTVLGFAVACFLSAARPAVHGHWTWGAAPPAATIGLPAACQARMPPVMFATS